MLSHRDTGPCKRCKGLRQCDSCLTEFGVQIYKLGGIGHVLEFTSWKNFGPGRAPLDPKWANHVVGTAKSGLYAPRHCSTGSIRPAFDSERLTRTAPSPQNPLLLSKQHLSLWILANRDEPAPNPTEKGWIRLRISSHHDESTKGSWQRYLALYRQSCNVG